MKFFGLGIFRKKKVLFFVIRRAKKKLDRNFGFEAFPKFCLDLLSLFSVPNYLFFKIFIRFQQR
jgi:hypothetical protein